GLAAPRADAHADLGAPRWADHRRRGHLFWRPLDRRVEPARRVGGAAGDAEAARRRRVRRDYPGRPARPGDGGPRRDRPPPPALPNPPPLAGEGRVGAIRERGWLAPPLPRADGRRGAAGGAVPPRAMPARQGGPRTPR